MFAALYGRMVPHRWRGPEPEGDAYSLFYQRSLAMGWLDGLGSGRTSSMASHGAGGLWSMNDAGWDHPLAPVGTGLVAWFQVEVEVVARDRPLPVQPFLRCAGDATNRAGALELDGVQLLLPVHGLDPSSRPPEALVPSLLTMYWFHESDPDSRVQVEVNVNSGLDPTMSAVGGTFVTRLRHLDQSVFSVVPEGDERPGAVIAPPFDDRVWNGPPLHGLTLWAELSEWTLDAIGWMAEVLADTSAAVGVRSPLLLTVTLSGAAEGTVTSSPR